jgi:membrane protease YdiL (CAAX protease family)
MINKNKKNTDTYTTISKAIVHVIGIVIISLAIIVMGNELFHGTNKSNMFILMFISAYIIFSFARKYWVEKKPKKIMEAIDITMTLVGGFTVMMISVMSPRVDTTGYAFALNIFGGTKSQPHVLVFYLGMLLLIVGAIRMYMVNKEHHRLKNDSAE